jgi:hypothetical protein
MWKVLSALAAIALVATRASNCRRDRPNHSAASFFDRLRRAGIMGLLGSSVLRFLGWGLAELAAHKDPELAMAFRNFGICFDVV